uniref:Uncharacterized protein n=1 Tax=Sphaerodactylus townsendi TaxID=933632 RepID=A0ACB8EDC1_9SAUR
MDSLLLLSLATVGTFAQIEVIPYVPRVTDQPFEGKITASTFALDPPNCVFDSLVNTTDEIWLVVTFTNGMMAFLMSVPGLPVHLTPASQPASSHRASKKRSSDGSLQCPSCKAIYGEKTGTQPSGRMDVSKLPDSLPGNEDCGSIQIAYYISKGIQGPEHPNPGMPYTARGFPRYCYLPDNAKGKKVLELLQVAWKRRLIFTIGTSSTTGESNTVVWNEIHHKTEMSSNASGHGYPDPNYLRPACWLSLRLRESGGLFEIPEYCLGPDLGSGQ